MSPSKETITMLKDSSLSRGIQLLDRNGHVIHTFWEICEENIMEVNITTLSHLLTRFMSKILRHKKTSFYCKNSLTGLTISTSPKFEKDNCENINLLLDSNFIFWILIPFLLVWDLLQYSRNFPVIRQILKYNRYRKLLKELRKYIRRSPDNFIEVRYLGEEVREDLNTKVATEFYFN